ncbi:13464_t:CDS:2 [Funneliformis mosseae]|uniref:13464_t:CDS:1 n=1 Tax=Funneliformis mosseae TaxID=27381 RepID=A0A9N8ZB37_FUNMO|nr:13464_t:CDS:2 [Funneliformis mosseae]
MDPSLYQQRQQQQNRVPYGNPQGPATVMSAAAYPQPYMTANTAYLQQGTGLNPMMSIPSRPVYQVPVASVASMTANGRSATKRVALGSGTPIPTLFSNIGQTPGQNQLYTGFPSQQIINAGRSTVPTQSFVNTDNQNMDSKSAYLNKYLQLQAKSMGNNFNNLLNQNQSPHPQQSNQAIHNSIQQEDSQVDWLDLGDEDDIPIQITQTSQQREETGYNYSSISLSTNNVSSISQNLSPKNIQNNSLGMLPRSPIPSSDSSSQALIYGNQNQSQTVSQIGQFSKMVSKDHLSTSNSMISNYSQSSTRSSISPEITSNSGIQSAIVDQYNQSPRSTIESATLTSLKSNPFMSHIEPMQRIASQEHQGESSSILPSNDNPNSFNANVQATSMPSRLTSSTDNPKDINNLPTITNFSQHQQTSQPFNAEIPTNQPSNQIGNIAQSSIAENATPNLRLPVSSGIAGRRNINSRQVSRQSEKTTSVSDNLPSASSSVPDQTTSTPSTKSKPQKVNYAPKTRKVDSYGGLDLRVFEKFNLPLTIPGIQELGAVDVHALTMSLKCGMKLEVTNALNTLTTLSHKNLLELKQCGELIDVLFDMILEYVDYVSLNNNEEIAEESIISQRKFKSYRELYQLSKQECEEFALRDSISEEWLPLHEQCWCVTNMIRNFSFNFENQEYLAAHPRFLAVLMRILYIGCDDNYMKDTYMKDKANRIKVIRKKAYYILELRKSVLIILSNIAAYIPLPSIYVARDLLTLIGDFMDSMDDYYSQIALEVFAKLSVSYDNRQRIGGCDESTLTYFFNCLIQMLPKIENIIHGGGGRLMAQELPYLATLVMAFYNFVCLSGEGMRKKIISTPGFINRMLRMAIALAGIRDNRDEDCIMLARRAMEMLKVLAKGNEECFLVYNEQLLLALFTPYIDHVVVKDLESIMYPGDL